MNKDDYYNAIELMEKIGGSFASSLAKAARHADRDNWLMLYSAFSNLFNKYKDMAEKHGT